MDTKKDQDIKEVDKAYALNDYEGKEQQELLAEAGELVFESSLIRYLADATAEETVIFEKFVEVNADKEDLLERLCDQYPDFAIILKEEIVALQNELS